MIIVKSVEEWKKIYDSVKNKKIGFVPTMGGLHEGHISLVKRSKAENEITVVSVYLNPTQFNDKKDLETYPCNFNDDCKLLEENGVDYLFAPDYKVMYPDDFKYKVIETDFSKLLCGAKRPGHFDGVCTILTKFFNLIKPTNAYFGKKDTQQLLIVENMVKSLFMYINIIGVDIVRSSDGLALSSRNSYLNDDELAQALKLSRSLMKASNLIKANQLNSIEIKKSMSSILEPLKVDYIEIVDKNLKQIENIELGNSIILVAAYVGNTRLIDNLWV